MVSRPALALNTIRSDCVRQHVGHKWAKLRLEPAHE